MIGQVFQLIKNDPVSYSYFKGQDGIEVKAFPFGEAPTNIQPPYAVYQTVSGSPLNQLSGRPQTDYVAIQVDVYAASQQAAYDGYKAIEHALELSGYVTGLNEFSKDPDTNRWRASFDYSYYTQH